MISGCYATAGVLMALSGYLFVENLISPATQTALWAIMFFFASAAASAAYLTVSEVFPMEIRAMAIALFYAIGTALGGITGPIIFGQLNRHARAREPLRWVSRRSRPYGSSSSGGTDNRRES